MYIDEYILTDSSLKPIYRTFDLVDLANKIVRIDSEIKIMNMGKSYEQRKKFKCRLIVEKHEIKDLEKSDK